MIVFLFALFFAVRFRADFFEVLRVFAMPPS